MVTDSNRDIVSAIAYHPFGEPSTEEGEEHYLFTEKEKDETGLYYYGARYYDPDLGRFLTRDPYIGKLVKPQSLNQYTYCYNNPLLFVDPDGRDPLHYEGPIYYGEEEKTLVYSHAPQLMNYVDCEEGYEWFAYFCIGEGIVFSIVLTSGAITCFFPNAGPTAIAFIKWLVPAALKLLEKHKWKILIQIISLIISLIASDYMTEREVKQIMSESDSEESASFFEFLAKFEEAWGMKAILVEYNEDGTYTVKFKDKSIRTFKCIDGDWVEIPTSSEDEETS